MDDPATQCQPNQEDQKIPTVKIAGLNMPEILDGDQLYDHLMSKIDPELTIAGLETLDAKYKDETTEQAKERAERYQKAFDEYQKRVDEYSTQWENQFHVFRRTAMASLEHKNRKKENDKLAQLESAMANI